MFHPHRWRFVPWPLVLEKQVCWLWPAFTKPRHDGSICVDDGVFFWGEALFWTTRAPVSSTFLTCWSTFEVVIIPICFGRYSKWRQKFYDMKIVRCIMIYIYDTFNSQQNQENQVNSSPTTDLWKNPSNVFCRTMAHQLPALLGCLVFGYGLCWYCWLCLVFGLRISWYMFSGKGRFLMIWWGGLFNMTWWHLGEMSLEGSYFKWNVKNLASTKEAPMTQQQLQVDVGWNPFFFSFHVQGCQVACQNMCLSERQKCRKVFE